MNARHVLATCHVVRGHAARRSGVAWLQHWGGVHSSTRQRGSDDMTPMCTQRRTCLDAQGGQRCACVGLTYHLQRRTRQDPPLQSTASIGSPSHLHNARKGTEGRRELDAQDHNDATQESLPDKHSVPRKHHAHWRNRRAVRAPPNVSSKKTVALESASSDARGTTTRNICAWVVGWRGSE
jgi:hypothetical protein